MDIKLNFATKLILCLTQPTILLLRWWENLRVHHIGACKNYISLKLKCFISFEEGFGEQTNHD